jgi:transcriptional regulator
VGRKLRKIDPEQVVRLAKIGCTQQEIADILGESQQTISRRFGLQITRARASLNMSLRRAQFKRAVKDRSDAMLIHLGKVYLGQAHVDEKPAFTLADIVADAEERARKRRVERESEAT